MFKALYEIKGLPYDSDEDEDEEDLDCISDKIDIP